MKPITKLAKHLASLCTNPDLPCPSDTYEGTFECPFFPRDPKCHYVSVEKWKRWIKKNIIDEIKEELKQLGIGPLDYVQLIVDKYNEIRKGDEDSILLVIAREKGINDLAVVDLEYVKTNTSD